jgi:spore coat polysaccharide biosynthesis protein SpsF
MNNNKIGCIIQARVLSSRLPAKILLNGFDKPLLLHTVERLKKSAKLDKIIVATTNLKIDNVIFNLCKKNKILVFRGHPTNLLNRYYNCAKKFKFKNIIRITSDCPLMDSKIIDVMIGKYKKLKVDYFSNVHPPTFPDGFDIEIFSFESLQKAFFNAKEDFQKEHVTPFIWDQPKKFIIKNYYYKKEKNLYNKFRLTLDYIEDYFVINQIYNALYLKNKYFSFEDVLKFIKKNPKIMVNRNLIKVNWYKNYLKNLKTIKKKDTK